MALLRVAASKVCIKIIVQVWTDNFAFIGSSSPASTLKTMGNLEAGKSKGKWPEPSKPLSKFSVISKTIILVEKKNNTVLLASFQLYSSDK